MLFPSIVAAAALKAGFSLLGTGLWTLPLLIMGLAYYRYLQNYKKNHILQIQQKHLLTVRASKLKKLLSCSVLRL